MLRKQDSFHFIYTEGNVFILKMYNYLNDLDYLCISVANERQSGIYMFQMPVRDQRKTDDVCPNITKSK